MSEPKRILLVEDSPKDVELTLSSLSPFKLDRQVAVASDGAEALDYLQRTGRFANRPPGHPAVVLLDIKMPKLDGFNVLRSIRNDPDLRMIPVVILTSSREDRDLRESYQLGANAFVVKPVAFKQFVETVRTVSSFWSQLNEPPPGCAGRLGVEQAHEPPPSL